MLTWCYYDSGSRVFADNVSWGVRILRHVQVQVQGTVGLGGTKGIRLHKIWITKIAFPHCLPPNPIIPEDLIVLG